MRDTRFDAAIEVVRKAGRIVVVSHVSPEGDAVGSLLGMTMALRSIGKDAVAYLEDPVPELFMFLPGADTVVHSLSGQAPFDAAIAVDCGQKERLGAGFTSFNGLGTLINIDHHATNDRFGDINIIEPDASAAGEMVFDFCKAAGVEINRDVAINLYVAIHTDTGSFRYSSSTPEAFAKAGELVRRGADPWELSCRVYENHPARKYELLALVLSTLKVIKADGFSIAVLFVTLDMFKKTGAEKDLADGFVNYARGIQGVEVGMLLRETSSGAFKVSMRSKGRVDVAAIAAVFGGGGHRNAAGCAIKGTMEEIKAKIAEAIRAQASAYKS